MNRLIIPPDNSLRPNLGATHIMYYNENVLYMIPGGGIILFFPIIFNRMGFYGASRRRKLLNLVLSGGGVKGIAYIGVFEEAERRGYGWTNMAGVSAGALAGAFAGAGLKAFEMWNAMEKFDFKNVQLAKAGRLPVVSGYLDYAYENRLAGMEGMAGFLGKTFSRDNAAGGAADRMAEYLRGNILQNIVTFSKEGCLFDGDYLEEWVFRTLAAKGVRTFGDLRGGQADDVNPRGYRVRMTGVDCNRAKLVVLPDDMAFYGIEPDNLEVAKAVRISTCVPFAFKPVEIKKKEGGSVKTYNLVDGGVFDRFPLWLIDCKKRPTVGFKLSGGEKKKLFGIDTGLEILKGLVSAVQDIGMPKGVDESAVKLIGEIDTTKVSFLDFDLSEEDKSYMYNAGKKTASEVFDRLGQELPHRPGIQRKMFFPGSWRK